MSAEHIFSRTELCGPTSVCVDNYISLPLTFNNDNQRDLFLSIVTKSLPPSNALKHVQKGMDYGYILQCLPNRSPMPGRARAANLKFMYAEPSIAARANTCQKNSCVNSGQPTINSQASSFQRGKIFVEAHSSCIAMDPQHMHITLLEHHTDPRHTRCPWQINLALEAHSRIHPPPPTVNRSPKCSLQHGPYKDCYDGVVDGHP